MKKIGKCDEVRNIYLGLFTIFLSFIAILISVYLLKIKEMPEVIRIIYFVLIGIFIILAIPCLLNAFYILLQKETILIIDEQTAQIVIQYRKRQRVLSVAVIEDIQIKQGFIFLNHLMKSTILIYIKEQVKPFKIRFAYPPLVIKNEILKLKEKV